MNINQLLLLLGNYVAKFHLEEDRAKSLEDKLTDAENEIETLKDLLINRREAGNESANG